MNNPSRQNPPINHEEHQRLAYQLWEQASRPSGRDLDFWLSAEQQLIAQSQSKQAPAARTPGNTRSNGARATPKAAARRATKAA